MKTRLLIIIVIILLAVSITYVSFAYNQEIKLATGMMQREEPGTGVLGHCPELEIRQSLGLDLDKLCA